MSCRRPRRCDVHRRAVVVRVVRARLVYIEPLAADVGRRRESPQRLVGRLTRQGTSGRGHAGRRQWKVEGQTERVQIGSLVDAQRVRVRARQHLNRLRVKQ